MDSKISIGEVDPFKVTRSSNTGNKLLARIWKDLRAMLFAKWITTPPKNFSLALQDLYTLIEQSVTIIEHSVTLKE